MMSRLQRTLLDALLDTPPQIPLQCSLPSTGQGLIFLTPRSTPSASSRQHNTGSLFAFAKGENPEPGPEQPAREASVCLELEQTAPSIFPVQHPLFYVSYLHCKAWLAKTRHRENDLIKIPLQQQQQKNNIALLSLFMIFY